MGRSTGSIRSSSITTDVSRIPRGRRCSRTWGRILVEQSVDVRAETLGFDGRCAGEDSDGGFGGDELPPSERGKLADRYAVSRYDERLPPVERAHDLATLIAQLSLCDLPCHLDHCSTCATLAKVDAASHHEASRRDAALSCRSCTTPRSARDRHGQRPATARRASRSSVV